MLNKACIKIKERFTHVDWNGNVYADQEILLRNKGRFFDKNIKKVQMMFSVKLLNMIEHHFILYTCINQPVSVQPELSTGL